MKKNVKLSDRARARLEAYPDKESYDYVIAIVAELMLAKMVAKMTKEKRQEVLA